MLEPPSGRLLLVAVVFLDFVLALNLAGVLSPEVCIPLPSMLGGGFWRKFFLELRMLDLILLTDSRISEWTFSQDRAVNSSELYSRHWDPASSINPSGSRALSVGSS